MDREEIEMYDEPFWTWENVIEWVWRLFVIAMGVAFSAFLVGVMSRLFEEMP